MNTPFRCTLIALCTLFFSQIASAKSNQQSIDGIIAIVNDIAITQSEINTALNAIKAQLSSTNAPLPSTAELKKKVLNQVIDRKLELQAAEQAGIKVTDQQLDDAIDHIAKENHVSTAQLYQKVTAENLTRTEYRKEIHDDLMLQQIQQQQVGSKIIMAPEDVKNFMRSQEWQAAAGLTTPGVKEYHLQDVIVLLTDGASEQHIAEAKIKADALVAKAKQGTDFKNLAAANDKTVENSDLGWRQLNEIPSAFAGKIAQIKKGSILGPIQTGNGFHIIRLTDSRIQKSAAPASAQPALTEKDAQQMVYQRKFADALKKWIAKLRSQAVINLHPDAVV